MILTIKEMLKRWWDKT